MNLQDLCDYINDTTGATGVYIGALVYQKKAITEESGENEDLDDTVPKVIQFTHASNSHKSLVNTVLSPEQAPISHSVFNM